MDRPQVDDSCPAPPLLCHGSVPCQHQTRLIALAGAGAVDGAALPAGGENAKKNLAFVGICCVFLRREELGGCGAFVLGSGWRSRPGRARRCPTCVVWGSFAQTSSPWCPGGVMATPPTPLIRVNCTWKGQFPSSWGLDFPMFCKTYTSIPFTVIPLHRRLCFCPLHPRSVCLGVERKHLF